MSFFRIDRAMPEALRAGKIRGVHLAIVVDNTEGNGNTIGYQIKVKYPWMNDTDATYWARIAIPMRVRARNRGRRAGRAAPRPLAPHDATFADQEAVNPRHS